MNKRKTKRAVAPFHLLCKPIGCQCNLRCEHCFYLEKESLYENEGQWKMPDKVLDKFIKLYIESQPEWV
ncbi:MAG: anaerobic sulfatase maturase, partial [Planctomycetes bacterium]|nr:anaerobic sulfatase maturase [Planctomycetota bacterium]